MSCISPPELDERQLLKHLDGEPDAQVAAHLEHCPHCRERSGRLAGMQSYLIAQLYRISCPTSLELGDYALGMLAKNQAAQMAAHLRDCRHCQREVSQLKDYLADLAPAPKASPLEQVKVLIARLAGEIQDNKMAGNLALAPAFATLRGGAQGPITMEADGILIALDVQPAMGDKVSLMGQVAAGEQERWTGAVVELRQGGVLQMTTSLDDLGAFQCEGILPGATELQIKPEGGPIVLANIEVVV